MSPETQESQPQSPSPLPETPPSTPSLPPVVQAVVDAAVDQQASNPAGPVTADTAAAPNPAPQGTVGPTDAVEGNVATVGVAQDNMASVSQAKKPSKMELKRQQIFFDRLKRKMGETVKGQDGQPRPKTQQEALMEMQREDYEALPLPKKLERMEGMLTGFMQRVGQDMMNLRRNDGAIADAFDMNYRAIGAMFTHLGINPEQQKEFMSAAREQFENDRKAKMEADAKAAQDRAQAQQAAMEKARMDAAAAQTPAEEKAEQAAAPSPVEAKVDEGATVFEG